MSGEQLDLFRHQPVLEEAAAVGDAAVSGSAPGKGEPERAAVSSSTQLTELPGTTWEDIFKREGS